MTRRRKVLIGVAALVLGGIAFVYATNASVLGAANGRIYTDPQEIPERPVAVVLGAAATIGGRPNLFFERRMSAAARLYREHRVAKLLVSGDNGSPTYDEPTAMRDALMKRGVPEGAIVRDYAGFRTLDSIVRAKEVFGVDRCTIVTDDFHLPRALYIARERGVDAVGFQTVPLPRQVSPITYTREIAARVLVWLDVRLNRQPKFLGPQEPIEVAKSAAFGG